MTPTSRLKNWFPKAPLGQAVLLAFIQAYGWLWIHVVALSFISDTLNGEAAGIGVIFLGWIWALLWGWVVCWPISRRIIGGPSIAGYTTAAVLQLPGLVLIFILLIAVPAIRLQLPSIANSIPLLLNILGLGILPEGRRGFSGIHTFMFLAMFAMGTFGFYLTAIRWRKAHEALKSLVLIGGFFFGLVKATYAYDIPTHKTFLTERSAILLHKDSGQNYQELLDWKLNLMTGTGDEDGGLNFLEHFYRPSDGVGLWSDPRLPKPLNTSALNRLLGQSPLRAFESDPTPYFANAVEEYMLGHKSDAYLTLGRTLHLATQDMFSPPHTHNDAHLNVSDKCFFEGIGLNPVCPGNRAQNSYEGWTSENFSRNTTDSRAAGTGIDPSVRNLVPAAADVGSLLDHNAQSTYKTIRVQGTLNKSATNPANGTLAAMFPAFDPVTNPKGMTYEMECSKWSALFNVCIPMHIWTIKGVGEMHEHEGGQGDSITDHWWKAQNFSVNDPGEYYYLENPKSAFPRQYSGATTSGESLAELWALGPRGRDPETAKGLMARSQEASAGLMKRFAELVDAIPPDIMIKDSAGRLIAANGSSKSPEILITAIDPVNQEQPTASGIYKVVLTQVAGHFSSTWNFTGMQNGVVGADTRELTQIILSPASYIVTAHDGLGNQNSVRFMISPFSPAGELNINASAVTINAVAGTFSASLGVDLFDPSGISAVTLTKAATPEDIVTNLTVDSNVPGATARVTPVVGTPFSSQVGDLYTLEVYNAAGDEPVESGFFLSGDSGVDLFQFGDSVERPSALTMTGMEYTSGGLRLNGTQGEYLSEIVPTQRPSSDGVDSENILLGAVLTAASGGGGAYGFEYSPLQSGPASAAQPPGGQITVRIRTGDTPAAVADAPFTTIMSETLPGASVTGLSGGGELALKKYYQVSATMNTSGGNCAEAECSSACPTEQPNCHLYYSGGAPFPIVHGLYSLPGYDVHASKPFNVSPGTNASLTMEPSAPNVQLTIPQINRLGNVIAGYYIVPGPSDKNTLPLDQAVSIRNEADVTGPIAIKIDYGESVTLTDEEAAGLTIVRTDPLTGESVAIDAVVVSTTEHTVAGTFAFSGPGNFGSFQVQYPKIAPPVPVASVNWVGDGPEFQILAAPGDLAVATVPQSDPQVSAAIPAATTAGLSLISNVYQTQTTAASFQPAGAVVFRFNSGSPAMESISPASLKVYQLDPLLDVFILLSPQVLDQAAQSITVSVSTPGIYAIFGSPEASSATLVSLQLAPSSATLRVGESEQFAVTGYFTDGSSQPIVAFWSSDAPEIATITASGFATGMTTGTAQITASSGSITASTSLTISSAPATLASLEIDPSSATIHLGETGQFAAIGFFTDGSTAPVLAVWSSDAPEIATITASGFATALATGTAQITASSGSVTASTSLTISSAPATLASLEIDPSSATILVGESGQFAALGFFTDGSTAPVLAVWSSDAPEIATITASGFATALATGTAQVTASSGSVTASTSLTVVPPPVLTLTPAHGSTVTVNPPLIVADFSEFGPGLDAASIRLELDGVDVTTSAAVFASSISFAPAAALAEGTHEARFQASDFDENVSSAVSTFFIDSLPPVTALLVNGLPAGGTPVVLTTTDTLSFSAEDAGTGAKETRYALNGGVPQLYLTPFTVGLGTHTLEFASSDFAGNEETAQTVELAVSSVPAAPPPEIPSGDGLAVAADPSGNLWEVVRSTTGEFRLVKLDGDGGTLAAVVLPGAFDEGRWSVLFDSSGSAHAIGSSANPSTDESRVAVYRADAAGLNLLSSTTFNAPPGTNSFAFDAAGGFRIAGVLLEGDEESFTAALGLWKYDPQTSLLELTTTYGGAGFDAGLGVRLDDGGNIWVIGFSSNPATPGPNRLDLALWKFDPSGTSLLAGPFRRPGYLRDPDDSISAALVYTGQGFLAAASKLNDFGNTDLSFHKFDAAGEFVYERLWHGAAGLNEVPRSMALDAEGKALIVGGTGAGENFAFTAWRYGQDGVLQSAETSAGTGEAQGLAVSGPNAWLAVATSTALVRFTGGTPLSGAEGAQTGGPADVLPPRTELLVGTPQFLGDRLYVASTTLFGFSAEDDFSEVGDGAGSGVAETRYAVDGGAFELFTASFSLAAQGDISLSWFSRDIAGSTEVTRSTSVFVDAAPPATELYFNGFLVAGSSFVAASTGVFTLAAADGGSGVSGTLYSIDQGSVQAYGSGFVLSVGTHSVSFASIDLVGNAEAQRSVFVDASAPPAVETGSLEGDIAYAGTRSGLYVVRASTDPAVLFDASSFQGPPYVATVAVAGPSYRLDGLAPGRYHVWIFKDVNGDGLRDRLNEPQSTRVQPDGALGESYEADVTAGGVARLDTFVMDWGEVSGTISNDSPQSGPVRVQLRDTASGWRWTSNSGGFGASPGGPYAYLIGFPTTTALEVTAFVDADNDNALGQGEDFGMTASPIAVMAGVIASGTDLTISSGSGQASSAAPVSAVTFPADGAIVSSLLTISGTAYDSDGVAGVDVRIQRGADGRYWNGVDYGTAAVFVAASGTTNWILESPTAIHSGTGTFVIASRARDALGVYQTGFPPGTSQITVNRTLSYVGGLSIASRSSTTLTVAWTQNGNPPGTGYYVHYTTGDCSANFGGGTDRTSAQVSGSSVILSALSPSTPHVMHMHILDGDGADYSSGLAGDFSGNIHSFTRAAGLGPDSTPPLFNVCGGPAGNAGLALSIDASGRIWEVLAEDNVIKLARFNSAGARETTVELPAASNDGDWSVTFGEDGNTYAIGTAFGLETGVDVALYKAPPAGDVLLATYIFDSAYSKNDLAFDSTGDAWITGAVQTSGPIDFSGPAALRLGLWKFCPHSNLLTLTTTYAGPAEFDAGFGVAVDDSSNVWVVGFSSNPARPSSDKLDLALWKFTPQGGLSAGPFLRPGYARDLNQEFNAKLAISSSGIYAAATRFDNDGNMDLGFVKYGFDGQVQAEKAWRSNGGGRDFAADMAFDAEGRIVIVGATTSATEDRLAMWIYEPSAALVSAQVTAAEAATDVAILGAQTWLAIKGSNQPYPYAGGFDIPGTEVSISTIADVFPPRSELTAAGPSASVGATLYVTSSTFLGFTAEDDLAALNDGLGAGVARTYYALDGGAVTDFTDGFNLVDEGSHTVTFFSVDLEGNAEAPQVRTVGVDLTDPTVVFVSSGALYALEAFDPVVAGAASGVDELGYLVDVDPESCEEVPDDEQAPPGTCANSEYTGAFTLSVGTHTVYFQVVDRVGNGDEVIHSTFVTVAAPAAAQDDVTAPEVSLSFSTPAFTSAGGVVTIGTHSLVSLFATDPASAVPASGVAQILYAIDETTPSVVYTAPFTLTAGTHTVYYSATDVAGNASEISSAALSAAESPFVGVFSPSSGPIGIAYSMAGFGFGTYGGANTQVRFGPSTSPVSVWNDASIVGTVPGLSTGAHAVTLERLWGSTLTISAAGTYTVTPLVPTLAVATGPIGLPFTLTGPGFGTFLGANSRVLFAGATAPISVWNDATISGTIPGVADGTTTMVVERQTADGFVARSEPLPFTVTLPSVTAVSPSSAPIGGGFALTGWSFGNYLGTNTQVLIGGATTPVSVWNDATIIGTVPGALPPGEHELVVERRTADGFSARSASVPFTVVGLWIEAISPSTGAIGIPFTVTGTGFGSYLGANSRVMFGVSTAAVSVWTDGSISGTIPTLATGAYAVTVERQQGADVSVSNASTFTVISPAIASVAPSSGPIGTVFTLSGTGFGPFTGANTFLLLGGATTPITVWNDATITATVPGSLPQGVHELVAVRRNADGGLSSSNTVYFTVTDLSIASLSPSTGAIGIPFTISGSEFGVYLGANSRVRFGVSTAAVSVWNNTTISGTVPTLTTGAYAVTVERQQGADVSVSNAFTFTVISPEIASVTPSSGPIGTVFTLSGAGFGPFAGTNTFLLLDGATTPISVWNDSTITATVPGGLTAGVKELTAVRRNADGGLSASNTAYYEVTGMSIASVNPSTGPIGIPFTIKGSQFGVFLGANSRVRFGVSTAAVSVWNDTTISGTLPALSTGAHAVVVERQQGTDVTFSEPSSFTVTELAIGSLTPSSGPIGVPFTITGSHFGPYAGTNTRLLLGGVTVAVSVWNDTTITGTVPNLEAGSLPLWLERKSGTGVQSSATAYFQVTVPEVATLVPSSAPIGAPFTITGTSFGPYAGTNTRVKFNGVIAAVSVWNDVKIVGTVPGAVSTGPAVLVVERAAGAGVSSSAEQAFEVLRPIISTVSPSYGPAGTVVSLTGHGFGPYGGTATSLLVGGSTVTVSVWNDATIRWTVTAAFSNGDYPLVVRRSPAGGTVDSEPASFTVGTGYSGASFGFSEPVSLAAQPDVNFEGGLNLPVDEGGRVETAAKAAVEVPPNALEEDTEITLKRLRPDGLRTEAAGEDKKRAAGEAIEFGPPGTLFKTPVTIELPYDPALAGDESLLAVHYYDPLRRAWEELPSVVDRVRRVVRAQTAHFSIYQPMGALAPQTAAQDEFYFRDQYAFPNPSRGGAVTFRIQPGQADTVELRVYDLSGRRVHSSTDFTFRGAIDDLNGKGEQNTYDHVWGVSGVGSGVYNYVIKASRAGSSPIVKKGKVGVIK